MKTKVFVNSDSYKNYALLKSYFPLRRSFFLSLSDPSHFPSCPHEFSKHTIIKEVKKGSYHFFKCFHNENNERFFILKDILRASKTDKCKNYTFNQNLFSWYEALVICRKKNATFPELYAKNDQDQFLSLIKHSKDVFPMEAIYTGFFQHKKHQVSVFCATMSQNALLQTLHAVSVTVTWACLHCTQAANISILPQTLFQLFSSSNGSHLQLN